MNRLYKTLIVSIVICMFALPTSAGAKTDSGVSGSADIVIELTWTGDLDLDLHVTGLGADGERFRVCYKNTSVTGCEFFADTSPDDKRETTRISSAEYGPYQVYVHDFSNRDIGGSNALRESGAKVKVLTGGEVRIVFDVPGLYSGNLWSVCALDEDSVTPLGVMTFEDDTDMVGRDPASTMIPGDIIMGTPPDTNIPTRWSHVGMYIGDGRVVEAYGTAIPVESFPSDDWSYEKMSYASYFRVASADDEIRAKAVEFVKEKVRNEEPYDIGFHAKQLDGQSWYCSEIVWAAYMHASDGAINIEHSPDPLGVYPWEIEHSSETVLVGGYRSTAPYRNIFQMAYVGIKRLFEYFLIPAAGRFLGYVSGTILQPVFVLFFFVFFGLAYSAGKKGPLDYMPETTIRRRRLPTVLRFRKERCTSCRPGEGLDSSQ